MSGRCLAGRTIVFPSSGLHSRLLDLQLELVSLVVEGCWFESNHVLPVQLVGDTCERRFQVFGSGQLEVPATSVQRDVRERGVRSLSHGAAPSTKAAESSATA